jgi:hypothetical protein
MKLPKLDLSKEGLSQFWLHHFEKLVLGISAILLGVFGWLGFSSPRYSVKTPKQVADMASQVGNYINTQQSWDQMKNFRPADTTAPSRIEKAASFDVESAKYKHDLLVGPVVKMLGLRSDPVIRPVEELIARSGTFPIYYREKTPDKLRVLPRADAEAAPQPVAEKNAAKNALKSDLYPPGKALNDLQLMEMPGVRPRNLNVNKSAGTFEFGGPTAGTLVRDVVAVTGLIPYENQYAEFQKAFGSAQGYYPKRDKPTYRMLQIQRREEGGEWVDISRQVMSDAKLIAPRDDSFVPDVIDPKYYYAPVTGGDPITADIPPILMVDYREFVGHPKVPSRQTVPKALKREFSLADEEVAVAPMVEEKAEPDIDPLSEEDEREKDREREKQREQDISREEKLQELEKEEKLEVEKIGSRIEYEKYGKRIKPAAPYKLVRFFDLRPPKGKRVQYRVRLWMEDPNDPDVLELSGKKRASEDDDKRDNVTIGSAGLEGGGGGEDTAKVEDLGEDGLEPDFDLAKVKEILVEPPMLDANVRGRLAKKNDDPELPKDFDSTEHQIATPWSVETEPVWVGGENFRLFAGKADEPPTLRIDNVKVPRAESFVPMVAATMSRDLNTMVPALREVRRGDLVNFTAKKSHVLNPVDQTVRVYENAEIDTNAVVVDFLGGEKLDIKGAKLEFFAPTEALVMDAQGNFQLRSDMADYRELRHAMFWDDESREVGRKRERPEREDRNNRGGGGGLPPDG